MSRFSDCPRHSPFIVVILLSKWDFSRDLHLDGRALSIRCPRSQILSSRWNIVCCKSGAEIELDRTRKLSEEPLVLLGQCCLLPGKQHFLSWSDSLPSHLANRSTVRRIFVSKRKFTAPIANHAFLINPFDVGREAAALELEDRGGALR